MISIFGTGLFWAVISLSIMVNVVIFWLIYNFQKFPLKNKKYRSIQKWAATAWLYDERYGGAYSYDGFYSFLYWFITIVIIIIWPITYSIISAAVIIYASYRGIRWLLDNVGTNVFGHLFDESEEN